MALKLLIILVAFVATIKTTPMVRSRPKSGVGILPIVECPDPADSPFPEIILAPSVAGQDLAANQFVLCVNGHPLIFTCPKGSFFNWSIMACELPYERHATRADNDTSSSSSEETEPDLVPGGPVPVPISPELPIPIRHHSEGKYPIPDHPITKPRPEVIPPVPVRPRGRRIPVPYY